MKPTYGLIAGFKIELNVAVITALKVLMENNIKLTLLRAHCYHKAALLIAANNFVPTYSHS